MATTAVRGYAAGGFALEIDGKFAGFLASVEGGGVYGEVVAGPPGPDGTVPKHIGRLGYEPLVVTCGIPDGVWGQWLTAFLEGKAPAHSGAIIFLDHANQQKRRLEWQLATIASVTFPGLDGASKEAAHLTVALRTEFLVTAPASGALQVTPAKTKAGQVSNFSVTIAGVDCTGVSSAAELTVSQSQVQDPVGEVRQPTYGPGPLEVGDLVLTVAEVGAADFTGWCADFLVRGNNGNAQEKTATISYKGPNLKDELFSVALRGVGIHRLAPQKQVRGAESISRLTASMYCEAMALSLPNQAAPAAAAAPADPATPADLATPADPAPAAPAEAPVSARTRLDALRDLRTDPTGAERLRRDP